MIDFCKFGFLFEQEYLQKKVLLLCIKKKELHSSFNYSFIKNTDFSKNSNLFILSICRLFFRNYFLKITNNSCPIQLHDKCQYSRNNVARRQISNLNKSQRLDIITMDFLTIWSATQEHQIVGPNDPFETFVVFYFIHVSKFQIFLQNSMNYFDHKNTISFHEQLDNNFV
ncbi:hypothetical protein RFI_25565 [Reticulomyxa filosa]|uniref:Uncharacterized protein n=1 Tax=Reticulomyxa filosa TaxID=46433 RepID=X6MD42_RETFI|nr:hypothetical protein RFI_25565 [Reticulomyxa filosa]|eukprot:ETO11809.1 hypothetical protein RFI_25565 [Reticulomyxa filosa]